MSGLHPNAPKLTPETPGLQVKLQKQFGAKKLRRFALNVEFEAPAGVTVIFGPSGSGKTTVLQCLAGLLEPDAGAIEVDGATLFYSAPKYSARKDSARKDSAREAPLVLSRNGARQLLGLRSPRAPERIYLVQADLAPFDFSDEERARIAAG